MPNFSSSFAGGAVRPAAGAAAAACAALARWAVRAAAALATCCSMQVAWAEAPAAPAAPAASAAPAAPAVSMGFIELPATADLGPVTVHYPSSSPALPVKHDGSLQALAVGGTPVRGNGRLVVISHGTGGSPWVHTDLARALVRAGFVVALPEHRGDTYRDYSDQGTFKSLRRRPLEVSRTIDAVGREPRLAPLLDLKQVGMYGMSSGGFTALTLAGGRWSPQQFVNHCDAHLREDFQFCVGVITKLTGGWLDGLKLWVARKEIHRRFEGDSAWQSHTDPRVAAIVAAVPAAAAFDMNSLQKPVAPLGLVLMGEDRWLKPQFHGEAVLAACASCELVAKLDNGGHGAMLSPLPPGLTGVLGDMLNDPPGFDRAALPAVDDKIVAFFVRHLLR